MTRLGRTIFLSTAAGALVLVVWGMLFWGLLGSNLITLGNPVWFHLPWDYTLGNLLYEAVAWLLLGLTTAALVRPATAHSPSA